MGCREAGSTAATAPRAHNASLVARPHIIHGSDGLGTLKQCVVLVYGVMRSWIAVGCRASACTHAVPRCYLVGEGRTCARAHGPLP